MQEVKEFIFSLMIISVSCAAITMLAPENSSLSKYTHFLVALVISVVLLSPIQPLVDFLPDMLSIDYDGDTRQISSDNVDYTQEIIEETVEIIKKDISKEIKHKFNKDVQDIALEVDYSDTEDIRIIKVVVFFEKINGYLFSDVKNFVYDILKCECEVKSVGEN